VKKKTKMNEITIQNRIIGEDRPCFIIAEAGVNHNNNFELAKRLVDAAVEAKADAIKFQLLTADGLYVKDAGKFELKNGKTIDLHDIWEKTEMPTSWIPKLHAYCQKKGIIFFCSIFDDKLINSLDPYVDVYKIGSSELTHIPLLKKLAQTGKPILIPLGGAEIEEIEEAVSSIRENNKESKENKENNDNKIVLMHCVAVYPTPLEMANVKALQTLRNYFPEIILGYSDHSLNPVAVPTAAISYGAKVIEKHFTLSREMVGIDHHMSIEPNELCQMVKAIRETERKILAGEIVIINPQLLGDGKIERKGEQEEIMPLVRRTIFATKEIKKDELFTEENIAVLRPGKKETNNCLHPREYFGILGCKATKDISPNAIITKEIITKDLSQEPLVSLIIRTHNQEQFIKKAVKSALKQDFDSKKYEIIVINDGSTDQTKEILGKIDTLNKNDTGNNKKMIIVNQENQGMLKSGYTGLNLSRGKDVVFLDGDDEVKEGFLSGLYGALQEDKEAGFSYCDYYEVDLRNGQQKMVSTENIFNTLACGILFDKKVLQEMGFWDGSFIFAEHDLLIRLIKKYKGTHVNKPLYIYNRHLNAFTANKEKVEEGKKQIFAAHGFIENFKEY
jgi:sialic acid synthase SpsE